MGKGYDGKRLQQGRSRKPLLKKRKKIVSFLVAIVVIMIEGGFLLPELGAPVSGPYFKGSNEQELRPALYVPPVMSLDVLEVNSTGYSFGPYNAIYQYGDVETGVFYSVSGNSTHNATRNITGFNVTLPETYASSWNLSYVSFFNATPIVDARRNTYYPEATLSNFSNYDFPITVSLTGVGNDSREIRIPVVNVTNIKLHFEELSLGTGDSLCIYNATEYAKGGTALKQFYGSINGENNTPWLNTTQAFIVLNSKGTGANYKIDRVDYQGVTYNMTGGSAQNWTILVDPEILGFNLTLSQLNLSAGSRFFYSDPWGKNVTELWNVGTNQNYTYVNDNRTWGPSSWIDPEYVVLAINSPDPANCNFTIAGIEYNLTRGWQRFEYPAETNPLSMVQYQTGGRFMNVSFAELLGSEKAALYPSWSFIFHKQPFNIAVSYRDETNHVPLESPVEIHYDHNYTITVNATDANKDPVDLNKIDGAPNSQVKLQLVSGQKLLYETATTSANGIANFTLNWSTGLQDLIAGEILVIVEVSGTNYALYDNTSARVTDSFYYFERPTLILNSITTEHSGYSTSHEITTTAGTMFDPDFVTFNISAQNNLAETEPLNGQPMNVTVYQNNIQKYTSYIYQVQHPNGANYASFDYSFQDTGNWSVIFRLENSTLGRPIGYFETTDQLQANVTVIPRRFNVNIYNGTEGLHPGHMSKVYINVTDLSEMGYPLVGWNVNLYYWRKVYTHFEDYFIGTATTNTTGIAQINWLPPIDLAGAEVYFQASANTPAYELIRFVPSETRLLRGFNLMKLVTNVSVTTDRPVYEYRDDLTFSVNLVDELGRALLGQVVTLNLTYNGTFDFEANSTSFYYNLVIGKNNTFNFRPRIDDFLGEIWFNLSYSGNAYFLGSTNFTIRVLQKVNTYIDLNLDSFGFNFNDDVPLDIYVKSMRDRIPIFDQFGDIIVEVYDANGNINYTDSASVNANGSHVIFTGWNPNESSVFQVVAIYTGGQLHGSCIFNQSVFIDRAAINVALDIPPIVAGQDLLMRAIVTYASNGQPVAQGTPVLFEYTDLMGNSYILGESTVNASGFAQWTFAYNPTPADGANITIYRYMVEFGGTISATSAMTSQYNSGFAILRDFHIIKCPTEVHIILSKTSVNAGKHLTITTTLSNAYGVSMNGERLLVEIFSTGGASTGQQDYFVPYTQFSYAVPAEGVYYIKVVYKGSNILEPNVQMVSFTSGPYIVTNEGEAQATSVDAQQIVSNATPLLFYLAVFGFILIITVFSIYKQKTSKLSKRRLKGLVAVALFLFADVTAIFGKLNAMPNPYLGENDKLNVLISPGSGFTWLGNEEVSEESKQDYLEMLGINPAIAQENLMNDYNGITLDNIYNLLGIGSGTTPRTAGEVGIQDLGLGTFGKFPYPIGDVINVSFSTNEQSNYFITITDLTSHQRVKNIYGYCEKDEQVNVLIPITAEEFLIGLDYALELSVYKRGSWDYFQRSIRRMVFSVIKGFTQIDVDAPPVDLYDRKYLTVTLTDKMSMKPISDEKVKIFVFDTGISDFNFYQDGATDENGQIQIPYPENSEQGEIPLKVVYQGGISYYGAENVTAYTIEPIDTFISISAAPVHYRDNGTITALLYDEYGQKLRNKTLSFAIYLENMLLVDGTLIEDTWEDIGTAKTNDLGYCSMDFLARYPEGTYEVKVEYSGDEIYNDSMALGEILEVQKELLEIQFLDNELTYGKQGFVSAYLQDNDGDFSINTPFSFSAYYNHAWHVLGEGITTFGGLATINTTVYFAQGTYPLRLIKQEDDRYAANVNYGNLTVQATSAGLDLGINSSQYCNDFTLSARLTCQNGSSMTPVEGAYILFYVETEIAGGQKQFLYVGTGITDVDGRALARCYTILPPGIYLVKAFFPGNGIVETIETCEYGLQILPAEAKIKIGTAPQVPILDYADFSFNLTDAMNNTIPGEAVHLKIYNRTDPTDVSLEATVLTDGYGMAFFRWVPGTLGLFTVEAEVQSPRYVAPPMTAYIEVIRKALVFNATMNSVQFHRGEICSLVGNASFAYKHQNGSYENFPAPSVPLRFYIWNESAFIHPVSGFLVPNVPLLNLAGQEVTYTGSESFNTGNFAWAFEMPDALYGLQAGRYFVKIKVDPTKTGFYAGEGYLSFDLVEYTQMNVTIVKNPLIDVRQGEGKLALGQDFYVDEWETIIIQLRDQDNTTLQPYNYESATNRNLTINIGSENIVSFDVTPSGVCRLYNKTQEFAGQYDPKFYENNGTYVFQWAPFLSGPCDVGVDFAGDRFFAANLSIFPRIVYRRPVSMISSINYTQDLYRQDVSMFNLQNNTWFYVQISDIISGARIPSHSIEFYYDTLMMTDVDYGLSQCQTNTTGEVLVQWFVPSKQRLIQAGNHTINFRSTESRNFSARWSEPHRIDVWEPTTVSVSLEYYSTEEVLVKVVVLDQDLEPVLNANVAIQISGYVENQGTRGGTSRCYQLITCTDGIGTYLWTPAAFGCTSGQYTISADFIEDPNGRFRPSSAFLVTDVSIAGKVQGTLDQLPFIPGPGDVDGIFNPFAVKVGSSLYYSLHEVRQYCPSLSNVQVNTYDLQGYKDPHDVVYVWQYLRYDLHYCRGSALGAGMILAFSNMSAAQDYIADAKNAIYEPRVVGFDFVWGSQQARLDVGGGTMRMTSESVPQLKGMETITKFFARLQQNSKSPRIAQGDEEIGEGFSAPGGDPVFGGITGAIADELDKAGLSPLFVLIFRILQLINSKGQWVYGWKVANITWVIDTSIPGHSYSVPNKTYYVESRTFEWFHFIWYFLIDRVFTGFCDAINELMAPPYENIFGKAGGYFIDSSLGAITGAAGSVFHGSTMFEFSKDMLWNWIFTDIQVAQDGELFNGQLFWLILRQLIELATSILRGSGGSKTKNITFGDGVKFVLTEIIKAFADFYPGYRYDVGGDLDAIIDGRKENKPPTYAELYHKGFDEKGTYVKRECIGAICVAAIGVIQYFVKAAKPGQPTESIVSNVLNQISKFIGDIASGAILEKGWRKKSTPKAPKMNFMGTMLGASLVGFVADLIIDIVLIFIPQEMALLRWILDSIVRMLAQVVIMIVFLPTEATCVPWKIAMGLFMNFFLMPYVDSWIEAVLNQATYKKDGTFASGYA